MSNKKRYRVVGTGQVHVHIYIDATTKAEALRKAKKANEGDWKSNDHPIDIVGHEVVGDYLICDFCGNDVFELDSCGACGEEMCERCLETHPCEITQ